MAIPLGVALLAALVAPLLVHLTMRTQAAEIRRDLRYQLSAYLDVVTMLLAANVGNEGALRQAARTGDGRLFVELRHRIVAAEAANRSLVSALARLGDDLQLIELQQIAASAALGAVAGAPGVALAGGEVRHVALHLGRRAGDRGPRPHRQDHRAARRHVGPDHGCGDLPRAQRLRARR